MTNQFTGFDRRPISLIVGGEGFRNMDPSHVHTLARTLLGMGLDVVPVYMGTADPAVQEAANNLDGAPAVADVAAEEDEPVQDTPIHWAEYNELVLGEGFTQKLVSRSWNLLTLRWKNYHNALARREAGEAPRHMDLLFLAQDSIFGVKEFEKELCIEEDVVSFLGLKKHYENKSLLSLTGVGPKVFSIYSKVIDGVEGRISQGQLESD